MEWKSGSKFPHVHYITTVFDTTGTNSSSSRTPWKHCFRQSAIPLECSYPFVSWIRVDKETCFKSFGRRPFCPACGHFCTPTESFTMELASWPTHIYIYRIIQQGLALRTKSGDVAFLYQIFRHHDLVWDDCSPSKAGDSCPLQASTRVPIFSVWLLGVQMTQMLVWAATTCPSEIAWLGSWNTESGSSSAWPTATPKWSEILLTLMVFLCS